MEPHQVQVSWVPRSGGCRWITEREGCQPGLARVKDVNSDLEDTAAGGTSVGGSFSGCVSLQGGDPEGQVQKTCFRGQSDGFCLSLQERSLLSKCPVWLSPPRTVEHCIKEYFHLTYPQSTL